MKSVMHHISDLLAYDPETGFLTWKIGRPGASMGARAGCLSKKKGYAWRVVRVNRRLELEHRLAWYLMTGEWPLTIDHVNGDATDNRWSNLRECTRSENQANMVKPKSNTSGLKGVSWYAGIGKWRAQIKQDYKPVHLGYFDCPAAAHLAYVVAADKTFGEFSCNGRRVN